MHKAFIWEFRHLLCRDENAISKSYANTLIASFGADPGVRMAAIFAPRSLHNS